MSRPWPECDLVRRAMLGEFVYFDPAVHDVRFLHGLADFFVQRQHPPSSELLELRDLAAIHIPQASRTPTEPALSKVDEP